MTTTIYHNSNCSTSRKVLALLENQGIKPVIIDYLKTPLTKIEIITLITKSGISVRAALREKGTLYIELGLDNLALSDEFLIDAIVANPILLNRPFVSNEKGVRLCRPIERVLEIL